ncbi:hypothetical protein A4A49_52473 [Nicotiana attenuata]|uniref:RNase H type-1 domain-containing protein n=1 Tax=Nicotiana attenuata TaxID=49451 RepID=A0A314L7F2_NICAT|nr:hypothetical protein A4A49_52473 [Nicotiana attenuata]
MWSRRGTNQWKINTDGSCMATLGLAGAGGIVRNKIGQMRMAFSNPLQFSTNNSKEVLTALFRVSWCYQNIEGLILELDSQLVVQMINGSCTTPWRLHESVESITKLVRLRRIQIQHCYREGNEVARALAKHATTLQTNTLFFEEAHLPPTARGALRMDRLQLPSFRIKQKKYSGWCFHSH